jgi:2-keto-4-pentenoate hydratase/2-oxohepta-3-ene-1,7-dioic acid hydratase in catechol pathway
VPEERYDQPLFYFSNPAAIVAPNGDVLIPPSVTQYDYELEVAAVVGRAGSDLTPGQGAAHIVGFTIMNDWSARDLQGRRTQAAIGTFDVQGFGHHPWPVARDGRRVRGVPR